MYIEATGLTNQNSELWDGYRQWNRVIAEYFYSGTFSGKPVYLDINDQLLLDIGGRLQTKDPIASFKRSIKFTLSNKNLFSNHLNIAKTWRQRKTEETPPFVALLAFFSYVAEKMVRDKDYAAHNYYGRLQRELDIKTYDSQSLQKSYRDISIYLWPLLNEWIGAWDGELGIPTARALDTRKYVSIAISQALVREQDRNLLKKLFSENGLTGGQRLRNAEMLSLLLHWASALPTPNSLSKLLIREGEVRDKVVEIACSELEMWDGRLEEYNESGEKNIFLNYLATFKDYPSPNLSLFLSANISSGIASEITFSKSLDTNQFIFECPVSDIRFEWLQDFGVSTIEPYERISQGDALLSKIRLENFEGNLKFIRNGQPVCILGYRPEIGAYQEVSRASLGQKSLILAHSSVKNQVASLIQESARPIYSIYDSKSCKGIPDEWFLFGNVQIINVISRDGLEVLAPLQDSSVNLSGGISLGYDTWLTTQPPEIVITLNIVRKLFIEVKQTLSFDSVINPILINSETGTLFIEIDKYKLPDGDYEININSENNAGEFSESIPFKLRSSNCIRLYKNYDYERLSHVFGLNEILGAVTAERNVTRKSGKAYLSGSAITSDQPVEIEYDSIELLPTPSSYAVLSDDEIRSPLLTTKTKETNSCIIRGSHIIFYPKVPENAPAGFLVSGRCTDCGLVRWSYAQRSKKITGRVVQIRNIENKSISPDSTKAKLIQESLNSNPMLDRHKPLPEVKSATEVIAVQDNRKQDLKQIFDGLCYLKEGRFEKFCSLVRNISTELWYPYELIRDLSALGHIDVQYDLGSMKPKYWRITDPCITNVGDEEFIITGWQSHNFIELVKSVSQKLGAEVIVKTEKNGLQTIKIFKISASDLDTFALIVSEESDYPLKAEKFFGEKLLTLLPNLSSLMESLEAVEMPSTNLEFLDLNTKCWERLRGEIKPGAYRHKEFGMRYFFLHQKNIQTRKAFICDVRLAKFFALREMLYELISYKESSLELVLPFGLNLPFLYERTAVAFSGTLPDKVGGQIRYKNIPADVAGGLVFKLSS